MACDHNCDCAHCKNVGLGAFGPVPPLAQHGFRLSIPGGPRGGQFHGRVSANATDLAYHGGRAHNLSQGRQDPFATRRAPGEVVPRPNASGDLNITTIAHGFGPTSPGFAMVPGGLFPASAGPGIGALPVMKATPPPASGTQHPLSPNIPFHYSPFQGGTPIEIVSPVNGQCPQGYTFVPGHGADCPPGVLCPEFIMASTCQPNTTVVPSPWQPPGYGYPAPYVPNWCPEGMVTDTAGNCSTPQNYPYPVGTPAQPSPVVPGPTSGTPTAGQPGCVSGEYDISGNCITSTVPGAATPSWFNDPNQDVFPGLPNWGMLAIAGGGLWLLSSMMKKK